MGNSNGLFGQPYMLFVFENQEVFTSREIYNGSFRLSPKDLGISSRSDKLMWASDWNEVSLGRKRFQDTLQEFRQNHVCACVQGPEKQREDRRLSWESAESTASAMPRVGMVLYKGFEFRMPDTLVISGRGQHPSESTREKWKHPFYSWRNCTLRGLMVSTINA